MVPYQDSSLEKLYTYARYLLLKLPPKSSGGRFEIDDEVALRFYRMQQTSSGSIDLETGEALPLKGPTEVGTGFAEDQQQVFLSSLIDTLNDRFGTDFKPADQLFFDQVEEIAITNETLKMAAMANSMDNFEHVFNRMLEGLFIDRMDGNEEIFDRVMADKIFRSHVAKALMQTVYERLRSN
jgi:type I restriction enzyme, R subunit